MKTVVRFFISTTAGVAAFASFALANMHHHGESAHHFSGEVRTRLNFTNNEALVSEDLRHQFENRARVNLDFMPMDSLKLRIAPQATHIWGTQDGAGADVAAPNAYLKEAWMSWMPSHMLTAFIGRQEISYGAGRVIGRKDWSQDGQHFDSARFRINYDMGYTDIFWAKLFEGQNAAVRTKDADLFALYTSLNLEDQIEFVRTLDFHAAYWYQNGDGAAENKKFFGGARAAGDIAMLFYDLELMAQFGKLGGESDTGFAGELLVGMNFMDRHMAALNFAYANQHYVNLLGDYHQFLGDSDILGRQNVMAIGLNTSFGLTDEFNFDLDGYYFLKAKKEADVFNAVTGAAGGTVAQSALGMEANARLGYQPNDMLRFEFGYALFAPGKAFKDAGDDKTAHRGYLQGTMQF
ncbi:MAG: hypothetical protein EA369_04070 [Bradymonadales bacterium]|nr:MAG: hypothetical protein EA369_04070 [Bradymonadales bacterium]